MQFNFTSDLHLIYCFEVATKSGGSSGRKKRHSNQIWFFFVEFRKVFKSKQTAFYKYRLADRKCVKPSWTYQTVINNSDGDSCASVNGCFQFKTYFCPHCWLESSYTKIIFIHDKCCCRLPHIWKLSSRTHFFLHHFIKLICSQVFWCCLYTHRVVFVVIGIVCYIMNIIRNGKTQSESPADRNSAV